ALSAAAIRAPVSPTGTSSRATCSTSALRPVRCCRTATNPALRSLAVSNAFAPKARISSSPSRSASSVLISAFLYADSCRRPCAGWHGRKRRHVVHEGGLAPAVAADDRDQPGIAGELLEVELDHIATQPIADATKAFERERDWSHWDAQRERTRLECRSPCL